jgi:hypothetical protein
MFFLISFQLTLSYNYPGARLLNLQKQKPYNWWFRFGLYWSGERKETERETERERERQEGEGEERQTVEGVVADSLSYLQISECTPYET